MGLVHTHLGRLLPGFGHGLDDNFLAARHRHAHGAHIAGLKCPCHDDDDGPLARGVAAAAAAAALLPRLLPLLLLLLLWRRKAGGWGAGLPSMNLSEACVSAPRSSLALRLPNATR